MLLIGKILFFPHHRTILYMMKYEQVSRHRMGGFFLLQLQRLTVIFFFCMQWSCSSNRQAENEELLRYDSEIKTAYTVELAADRRFYMDSLTSNRSHLIQYVPELEMLTIWNRNSYSIDFYNVNSGLLENRLILDRVGPEGVGNVSGYFIHKEDKIYLFDSYSNRITVVDDGGSVKDKLKFEAKAPDPPTFPYFSSRYKPLLIKNSIITKGITQGAGFEDIDHYEKGYNFLSYNLDSGKMKVWGRFPETYVTNPFLSMDYELQSFTESHLGEDFILANFPGSPEVLIYENEKLRGIISSASIEFTSVTRGNSRNNRTQMLLNDFDAFIAFDKWRNLYYRVISKAESFRPDVSAIGYPPGESREIMLYVYDTDFNIVSERKIGKEENLIPEMFFVCPEGLFICKNMGEEDFLVFSRILVKKK